MEHLRKYWKVSLLLPAYLAGMAFLMRHDPQMPGIMLGVVGLFASVIVLARLRGLTRWASANTGRTRLLGLVIAVAGPAAIIVSASLSGSMLDNDWITGAAIASIGLGSLMFVLPGFDRDRAISKEMVLGASAPALEGAGIPSEVRASFIFVLKHISAFMWVAAPWVGLDLILNLVAIYLLSLPKGSDAMLNGGAAFLVAYAFVIAFGMPAIAVAWHRYTMRAELPTWGVVPPNKRFWRYFYRVWIFGLMVGTLDKMVAPNAPDVAHFIGTANTKLVTAALEDAVWLLAIWAVGMYALVLPAVAIDDRDVNITVALRLIWPRRLQFAAGFLATILVFYLAITGLGFVTDMLKNISSALSVILSVFSFMLMLGAVATSATYLSRAYMRAKGQVLAA
jgi:hypothetical protein